MMSRDGGGGRGEGSDSRAFPPPLATQKNSLGKTNTVI